MKATSILEVFAGILLAAYGTITTFSGSALSVRADVECTPAGQWQSSSSCYKGGPDFGGDGGCGFNEELEQCEAVATSGTGCEGDERWEIVENGSCKSSTSGTECRVNHVLRTATKNKMIGTCQSIAGTTDDCYCSSVSVQPPETEDADYCDCGERSSS